MWLSASRRGVLKWGCILLQLFCADISDRLVVITHSLTPPHLSRSAVPPHTASPNLPLPPLGPLMGFQEATDSCSGCKGNTRAWKEDQV